jgi:type VI secretion system protein ImpD
MPQEAITFVENEVFTEEVNNETIKTSAQQLQKKHLVERFLRESDIAKSLMLWLENSSYNTNKIEKSSVLALLRKAIAGIDKQRAKQINSIIHHSEFQALEAAWRGVLYVVGQKESNDKHQKVKVKVLDCSWKTLCKDVNKAIEFDQSEFFKLVYNNEYDMSGGEPFGVLIGNYQISHQNRKGTSTNDIDILKDIARTAAAAFSPFITSAHPSFFGADNFSDLASHLDFTHTFNQIEYTKWNSLRVMDDARFLGITLPYILMRAPYANDGSRNEAFQFSEVIKDPQKDHLWGNASFAFAGVLIRAFSESAWFGQIRGMQPGKKSKGLVCDLPVCPYETDLYRGRSKPSINLLISDRSEKALSDNGFIPLSAVPGSEHLVFYSNSSAQKPYEYDSLPATVNAKLSSMLQYILCISRFAHYIKVLGREKIGSFNNAELCERELQKWLYQYTTASDSASDEVRSKYPLRSAQVQVKEMRGKPGHYYSTIQLQPHFQLDQMVSSIKLVTELTPKN